MKNYLLLYSLISLFYLPLHAQNTETGEFMYDGLMRDYFVYLPANYTPGAEFPLVFNFHGITSVASEQYLYTGLFGGMNAVADTGNFIVCYPNGTKIPDDEGNEWNVGFTFSSSTADDVGFVNALIDSLHAKYQIDLNRVYATGMSNGGYLCHRLACELTDRFQAIASVTGSIVPEISLVCSPSNSIPVLQIHGTGDPVVPFAGFEHGIPVEEVVEKWVNHNYCSGISDTFNFPDINTADFTTVQKIAYTDCHSNRQVLFYKVAGGEHTWPGSSIDIGITNQDIIASREIWEFFSQYTSPITVGTSETLAEENTIQLAPNPFGDYCEIQSANSPIQSIRLFDALGRVLFHAENLEQSSYVLPVKDLTKGVYFVQVKYGDGFKTLKILKEAY